MKIRRLLPTLTITILLSVSLIGFTGCNKDDETDTGTLNMKMTDAASDDENIQGVFITVAAVAVDDELMTGFEPQTIEISAYQNGNTKALLAHELEVGSYREIKLVFNYDQDASGNSPGCYVETKDGQKHQLAANSGLSQAISINADATVESESQTDFVIDLNLRKAIQRSENSGSGSNYEFRAEADFESSFRAENEKNTGEIKGTVQNNSEDKIVVYVYEKGSYNASSETQGDFKFSNSVTSAEAGANGNYTLSFVEQGEYELHMASYNKDSNGKVTFKGEVDVSGSVLANLLGSVEVAANSSTTVDIDMSLL